MIVDGLIEVGVCGVRLLVLLVHEMRVVLQRISSSSSTRTRISIEVVQPIHVRGLRLAEVVHNAVAMQQSGSVRGHAALLERVDWIVEVVWLLREIFHHVRDLGLEIGHTSTIIEQHRADDAHKEHNEEDDPGDAASVDWKQK